MFCLILLGQGRESTSLTLETPGLAQSPVWVKGAAVGFELLAPGLAAL